MFPLDHSRPTGSLRILVEAAQEYGLSSEDCLRGTGLSSFDLYNSGKRILLRQELIAVENFLAQVPDSFGLGIKIGRLSRPEVFGTWGYAVLSSPTLGKALAVAMDFPDPYFLILKMKLKQVGSSVHVTLDAGDLKGRTKCFVLERHLTVLTNFTSKLLPDFQSSVASLRTRISDKRFADAIERELDVNVHLNCDEDALILPADYLDIALPNQNPEEMATSLQQCKAQLNSSTPAAPKIIQQVRNQIFSDVAGNLNVRVIADRMGISDRTLRRRLTAEGTNFRRVLIEARLAFGRELLESTNLDISSVAWRVGYSEPSSFVRAFNTIYGHPPGKIKQQRLKAIRARTH
ncbi:putative HTH-type transcriptional regulator [Ruegeria sp. THAF57]|uniref:AraC family transcriptional regulator n=1 Tax=Ruegeria sp. THAF57 TaxID=2744555 RepID=UPI0015DFD74E|nr:AraC family transcriptional regulator [Ruegeria sp. THAF57]CAD0183959.1 putative HTH-type transcriptional regulator [Ruegeria sp. THAF57]